MPSIESVPNQPNCTALSRGEIPSDLSATENPLHTTTVSYLVDVTISNDFSLDAITTELKKSMDSRVSSIAAGCDSRRKLQAVRRNAQEQNMIIHYTVFSELEMLGDNVPCFSQVSVTTTSCFAMRGSADVVYSMTTIDQVGTDDAAKQIIVDILKDESQNNIFLVDGLTRIQVFDMPDEGSEISRNVVGNLEKGQGESDDNG